VHVAALWQDFKEKRGDDAVSYELYRRVFEQENIEFSHPSQDDCEICLSYNRHCKEQLSDHNADICVTITASKCH